VRPAMRRGCRKRDRRADDRGADGIDPAVNSSMGIASPRVMRGNQTEIGAGEESDVLRVWR